MQRERRKGHLDVLLLAAVAVGEAHGYAIIKRLREQSKGRPDLSEGTLYPALHRLESADLVGSSWATVAGRRRRVYGITPTGREALSSESFGAPPGHPSDVAVVGGGPAGMTAALLLARAGHRVSIFETADQLGGLWASRLDRDGYFRGDNSCKVYQSTYHSAPALFRLIGTDWRQHFTPQHDLTRNWLRPFVADCTWRDLRILGGAYVAHRTGLRRYHEVSVAEFIEARGISEPCRAWMRATALGGIAGTLRMTMWELLHRISSNVVGILKDQADPLYWNAQPPNSPDGFVSRWRDVLTALGVVVHTDTSIASLEPRSSSRGVTLTTGGGLRHRADAAFLAVPPPALSSLLGASADPIAEGFGLRRLELESYFEDSVYEHLGIAWFFDRELPNALPLGGNNVRRGWHPILVEHGQYRAQLRQPAVSVVIGSVAVDTDFLHHRLGTRADAYTHEEIAAIVWEDERLVNPSLPEPIECELMGLSSATQIVRRGPLPLAMPAADVFLATNMHGEAPYFTASLESAIQAGAIAAARFDPSVERLPTGRGARSRLPWSAADRTRRPASAAPDVPRPCAASRTEDGAAGGRRRGVARVSRHRRWSAGGRLAPPPEQDGERLPGDPAGE